MKYKRLLLKLSGESLLGDKKFGIDGKMLSYIADEIKTLYEHGYEIGIVVGAGNIYRGAAESTSGIDRVKADQIGMLGTVMNAISLHDAIEKVNISARIMSAIRMNSICEEFAVNKSLNHISKGRIIVFAAGTGNPFFTTDTAAVLRGSEIDADVIVKCTKVDGIYSEDPEKFKDAKFIEKISYQEVLEKGLKVMDATAISLAQDRNIPILVCSIKVKGSILNALNGKGVYTIVS